MNLTEIVTLTKLEENERQTIKGILNDWDNDGFSKQLEITHFKRGKKCIDVKKMTLNLSNIIEQKGSIVDNEIQKSIMNADTSHIDLPS